MTQATEKQLNYAKSLGIEFPQNYTKEALSKMIDEAKGDLPIKTEKVEDPVITESEKVEDKYHLTKERIALDLLALELEHEAEPAFLLTAYRNILKSL